MQGPYYGEDEKTPAVKSRANPYANLWSPSAPQDDLEKFMASFPFPLTGLAVSLITPASFDSVRYVD